MLLVLVPIIRDGKTGGAVAALELSTIRITDDFVTVYHLLTEDTRAFSADDCLVDTLIPHRENFILYGNIGAGKMHPAIATGVVSCSMRFKNHFWHMATLANALTETKRKGSLSLFMRQFEKLNLLICYE